MVDTHVAIRYIQELGASLGQFKQTSDYLWNFRCPYCGDSQKNKLKTRGYIYRTKSFFAFKCHNCGQTASLSDLLKTVDYALYRRFLLETVRHKDTEEVSLESIFGVQKPKPKHPTIELPTVYSLDDSHPARQYCNSRKITRQKLLYFAEDFAQFVEDTISPVYNLTKEPRIVIPFFKRTGELFAVQGRSLEPKAKLRYITAKKNDQDPLIFGAERVDPKKDVYVVEGPIDSFFLSNCIAVAGADLLRLQKESWFDEKKTIFVLDNEPRNKEILNRYDKIINANYRICIWSNTVRQKDINEMVLAGLDPKTIIDSNTFSGMTARIKFNSFKIR